MKDKKLFIPILLGTAREGRQSEKVASFVLGEVEKAGIEATLIDVREYLSKAQTGSMRKDKNQKWRSVLKKADALIIVSPEYNHSYPGELKIMLDQNFNEYAKKPIGLCGVSSGHFGGVRMIESLKLVLSALDMKPIREEVYFSLVENLFDHKGKITSGKYQKRVQRMIEELDSYARSS